ncbi:MAG TPA: hypothetical protein PLK37_12880 [Terricaulis sp.]|nr:hypothetical protein [Terricaulis sp.]
MRFKFIAALAALAGLAFSALAEEPSTPPAEAVQPAGDEFVIPDGAAVVLETVAPLSSEGTQRDQEIPLRLAEAIVIDGVTLAPAGAEAGGVLLDTGRGRPGWPGKIVIVARWVLINGERIPVHAAQFMRTGEHGLVERSVMTGRAPIFIPVEYTTLYGSDVELAAGARLTGHLGAQISRADTTSDIPAGHARVIFFRPDRGVGGWRTYNIHDGEMRIGRLRNRSSFEYEAPAGIHEFSAGTHGEETLRFEAVAGTTYYVRLLLAPGRDMNLPILRPSTRNNYYVALQRAR